MAGGTGTIIFNRGINMPYDPNSDDQSADTGTPTLIKGSPAGQLIGLSRFYTGSGFASDNYPNRIWMGMQGYGVDTTTSSETFDADETFAVTYSYTGSLIDKALRFKRPIWTGAEIRAFKPLKDNAGSTGEFVILKADWNKPSDYVLVTQKAISVMPLRFYERVSFTDDSAPDSSPNQAREYIEFSGWDGVASPLTPYRISQGNSVRYFFPDGNTTNGPSGGWVIKCSNTASGDGGAKHAYLEFVDPATIFLMKSSVGVTSDSNVALLGSDGAVKGKQTFLSPIGIESYVEILPYNIGATQYPATITSSVAGAASLFDTNITDLSMGGAAEFVEIGDGSTGGNTATTIYGQLTVTGPTILSTDTVIDGGTF